MRFNSILYPLGLLAASAMLTGCASNGEPSVPDTDTESAVWLSFTLDNIDFAANTRAVNTDWESQVESLIVYVTPKGSTDVVAYGIPTASDISNVTSSTDGSATYTVLVSIFGNVTKNTAYNLYVAANIPEADQKSIYMPAHTGATGTLNSLTVGHTGTAFTDWTASASPSLQHIPMGCGTPLEFTLLNSEYPYETPFETGGTVELTRLYGRLDFKDASLTTTATNIFPIDAWGGNSLSIEFKSIRPVNLTSSSHLQATMRSENQNLVSNPASQTYFTTHSAISITSASASDYSKLCYLPENSPLAENATFNTLTYLEFTGVLQAGANTNLDPTVRARLEATTDPGESLYYYDDGAFQSTLMAAKPADAGTDHWNELKWDAVLGGYAVTYRHAIRHGGVEGAFTDATDGKIDEMEYAVVRNTVYRLSISSVASLPHPTADTPESTKQDISVNIQPAKWTQYHRGVMEIDVK